jgi:integrase
MTEGQSDRVLTQLEEETYLAKAQPLLKDFATIALDTGMRPEEILRIRWEYVRFQPAGDAMYGYIHNPRGKTARAKRNLPMTKRVQAIMERRHVEAGKPARSSAVGPWFFSQPAASRCTLLPNSRRFHLTVLS